MAEQLVVVGGKRKEDREGGTPAVNTGQKNFLYFDFSFVVEFKQYYIHVEPSDPSCSKGTKSGFQVLGISSTLDNGLPILCSTIFIKQSNPRPQKLVRSNTP
ncbi:unnamed protein product [Fusarium graminearum]|nr:unnamed protein product [Fusarium graminearum]